MALNIWSSSQCLQMLTVLKLRRWAVFPWHLVTGLVFHAFLQRYCHGFLAKNLRISSWKLVKTMKILERIRLHTKAQEHADGVGAKANPAFVSQVFTCNCGPTKDTDVLRDGLLVIFVDTIWYLLILEYVAPYCTIVLSQRSRCWLDVLFAVVKCIHYQNYCHSELLVTMFWGYPCCGDSLFCILHAPNQLQYPMSKHVQTFYSQTLCLT